MKSIAVSEELAAIIHRKREARPWLDAKARLYELGINPTWPAGYAPAKGSRRRPSKRMRAAMKNRSA